MNSIEISHQHSFDKATACDKAEDMLEELSLSYGLEIESDGSGIILFSGSGITGKVEIHHQLINFSATLSFLMIALKPVITSEIKKKLDERFD